MSDSEKTIIQSMPAHATVRQVATTSQQELTLLTFGDGAGINPIVNAAAPLIILLAELKQAQDCGDVIKLRQRLIADVKAFTSKCQLLHINNTNITLASYLLCAALDEVILNLLQHRNNLWARQTLLSIFHKDGGAGEKFFTILEKLNQDPTTNQTLLELIALCLNLGFEGKYRVMENGRVQLELLKANLAQQLMKLRGIEAATIQTNIKPLTGKRRLTLRIPFYKAAAGLVILLLLGFVVFNYLVNSKANQSLTLLNKVTTQTT